MEFSSSSASPVNSPVATSPNGSQYFPNSAEDQIDGQTDSKNDDDDDDDDDDDTFPQAKEYEKETRNIANTFANTFASTTKDNTNSNSALTTRQQYFADNFAFDEEENEDEIVLSVGKRQEIVLDVMGLGGIKKGREGGGGRGGNGDARGAVEEMKREAVREYEGRQGKEERVCDGAREEKVKGEKGREEEEALSASKDDADVTDVSRGDDDEEVVTGAASEFRDSGESALWRSFR